MTKKLLFGIAVLAIAAVAAFNVNLSLTQESEMSVLELANIEALANDEAGGEVKIPCVFEEKEKCYFNMTLADGKTQPAYTDNMKNVDQ